MRPAPSILLVNGDNTLHATLKAIFEQDGYDVTGVTRGYEALAHVKAREYDLVLVGLRKQDMDGLELLPVVRRVYPDTPVLVVASDGRVETALEAMRQGVREFLAAPLPPAEVAERARQLLSDSPRQPNDREIISDITGLLDRLAQAYGEEPPLQLQDPDALGMPEAAAPRYLRCGRFTLDLWSRICYNLEELVPLPPSIFDFMAVLARHYPEPISYIDLVKEAQGLEVSAAKARKMCKWRIFQLRQHLEEDPSHPKYVITRRGVGVGLECE